MPSLEAQANSLGIPMQIAVDDGLRYSDCDAHMANLVSIEGKLAVYKGECMMGHNYEMRREIEELRRSAQIIGGELVFGSEKGFVAGELEDF